MKNEQKKVLTLSSNSIYLASLLAIVGGFLDVYTYISRDGVFANAQTGNLVLLGIKVANGEWKQAILYVPPLLAFILGVLISEIVKTPRLRDLLYSYRRSILILECIVLFTVGLLPSSVPNLIVTGCISFVSSLQISTFNKIDKWAYNSTMTTGNLKTATQAAYMAFVQQNQEAKKQFQEYSTVILSFLFGALVGTFSTNYIGNKSVWISVGILIISLLLYHRDKGYIRKNKESKIIAQY